VHRAVRDLEIGLQLSREMSDREQQVRLAQPRSAIDEEWIERRARSLRHGARRGHGEPVRRPDDVVLEAVARVQLHGQRLPACAVEGVAGLPAVLERRSTSSEMPRSVSNTPVPCNAPAENAGTPRKLSASSNAVVPSISSGGRSCLLYCNTSGTVRTSMPCSARLACRSCMLSMFSSSCRTWLSATNTTPSAPCSTSLRVEW